MKTRTTLTGLFLMLARPWLDAWTAERSAWVKGRTVVEITTEHFDDQSITENVTTAPVVNETFTTATCVVEMTTEIVTPEPAPVAIPVPTEVAVVPPAIVETTTPVPPAPVPATVPRTATKKARAPRKPSPVMAGAARTTKPRTRKAKATPTPTPVTGEPEDNTPSVFGKPFTVRMADTKADSGWSIKFTPIEVDGPTAGVLEITSKRSHAKYSVIEFPTGWEGRGFTLAKLQGGTDQENGDYSVFCSNRGPEADSCDCKGSVRFDHCKHRNALRALLLNDKL